MKILVFGASGKVGRLLVAELLKRGHSVTAFVHSHELPEAPGLTSVRGDVYDQASVEQVVAGHDAIISTLGSWGTKDKNVLSTAMQRIVPAAEAAAVTRIISLTGDGAQAPGDKLTAMKRVTHTLFSLVASKVLRDGEDHITILAQSSLEWTVLRSPVMTTATKTSYRLDKTSASLTVPRIAVVHALTDLVENGDWAHSAPFIRKA